MEELIYTVLIGAISGLVGGMAGGGGLISIPLLILMGLPAPVAIATNKLGGIGLSTGALIKYLKSGKIKRKHTIYFTISACIGALIGTTVLIKSSEKITLSPIIGVIILAFIPVILFNKNWGSETNTASKNKIIIGAILHFMIMSFAGFFGGGSGILAIIVSVSFFGISYVESHASHALPWIVSSICSLILLIPNGLINFPLGISLFVGMLLGGYLGAYIVVHKNYKWIKLALVGMLLILGIKIIFY